MRSVTLCVMLGMSVAAWGQVTPGEPMSATSHHSLGDVALIYEAVRGPAAGKPYQAERTTRIVQKLADGTVILQEAHGIVARSSSGQLREDLKCNVSTMVNAHPVERNRTMATAYEPSTSQMVMWHVDATTPIEKRAIVLTLPNLSAMHGGVPLPDGKGAMIGILGGAPPPPVVRPTAPDGSSLPQTTDSVTVRHAPAAPKLLGDLSAGKVGTERHEDLGKQSIEGLLVTGKRTTTTIAVEEIGNDRPIVIVSEVWTAPELGVVVKQVDSDPRTGERTMELTGITKTEPNAALFHPPADYKVKDMSQMLKSIGEMGKTPSGDEKK